MQVSRYRWAILAAAAAWIAPLYFAQTAATPKYQAIWEPVNYAEDLELLDVAFASEEAGWVAGGVTVMRGGVILHTSDGGTSWRVQLGDPQSADRAYRGLRVLDATHAWAVQGTGQASRLLHTADGENWSATGTIAEHFVDYTFLSDSYGIEADAHGLTMTHDGGRRWTPVAACVLRAEVNGLTKNVQCQFTALHFVSASVGYAVGKAPELRDPFVVFKTTDGGKTWSRSVTPPPAAAEDLVFLDEGTAFLRTGERVKFADGHTGWTFHYNKLSYTTDGGSRWSSREFAFPARVNAFCLPSARRGYVAGQHGMIYRYRVVPIEYRAKGMMAAPMMATPGR